MRLLKIQQAIASDHFDKTVFVEGMAGTGKTTAAIERVKNLLKQGVAPDSILILVPQSVLATPYTEAVRRARIKGSVDIHSATLGKLSYQMVKLFFPLVAEKAGFAHPLEEPHFLSLELVQYYMTRFVEPVIEQHDYFNSVHISRNRLYTQIVDNLNKSALMQFPIDSLANRLNQAWRGEVSQRYVYEDAQAAAVLFRERCLDHNLLDFSLQVDTFVDYLWQEDKVREHLFGQYQHLIVDNVEEDNPTTHQIIRDWLPHCESAVILYDSDSGFRRFLGADPESAYKLKSLCDETIMLDNHRVMSQNITALHVELAQTLREATTLSTKKEASARDALIYSDNRFHTQMIEWVTEHVADLIHNQGVPASEIVILAPYVPDALRFALQSRFNQLDVATHTHRPSRALKDEPTTRTMLTLAKLAHPEWGQAASAYDVASALMSIIDRLDLVRARLITEALYSKNTLAHFSTLKDEALQNRITYAFGNQLERLVQWLEFYKGVKSKLPIDIFMSKLFGEVLSQKGYGFHTNTQAANTVANLIDSAAQFRQTIQTIEPELEADTISAEYVRMVDRGVIANQYDRSWETDKRSESVLISPAYTFLLSNTPVDYQFWLNVGSVGWSQRLYQPLTHPYVLSQQWEVGRIWTDEDESHAERESLAHLVLGLIRRCRQAIYLGMSEYGEQGYEQKGALLSTIHATLRRLQKETA